MHPIRHHAPSPTGVDLIDEQHLVMQRMILDVEEAFAGGERPGLLVDALARFYQYAQIHFETEESLLARYVPQRAERHAVSHRRLLATLRTRIVDYKRDGNRIPHSVLDLLAGFTAHHTDRADTKDFEAIRELMQQERTSLLTRTDP